MVDLIYCAQFVHLRLSFRINLAREAEFHANVFLLDAEISSKNTKARTIYAKLLRRRVLGPTTIPSSHREIRKGKVGGVAAWSPAALQTKFEN